MKKIILFVLICMGSQHAHASAYAWMWCEFYAEKYAKYAYKFGDIYENIVKGTAPQTPERREMLEIAKKKWEEVEDYEYKMAKEVNKRHLNDSENKWHPSEIALADSVRQHALSIAGKISVTDYGKSQVYYQRTIENECKAK